MSWTLLDHIAAGGTPKRPVPEDQQQLAALIVVANKKVREANAIIEELWNWTWEVNTYEHQLRWWIFDLWKKVALCDKK